MHQPSVVGSTSLVISVKSTAVVVVVAAVVVVVEALNNNNKDGITTVLPSANT